MFFKFDYIMYRHWFYDKLAIIIGLTLAFMVFAQLIFEPMYVSTGLSLLIILITLTFYFYNKLLLRWLAFIFLVIIGFLIAYNTEIYYIIFSIVFDIAVFYYLYFSKNVLVKNVLVDKPF